MHNNLFSTLILNTNMQSDGFNIALFKKNTPSCLDTEETLHFAFDIRIEATSTHANSLRIHRKIILENFCNKKYFCLVKKWKKMTAESGVREPGATMWNFLK